MESMFAIVAPVATMIAAIMTAANAGARVTGWGFAVFLVGSLAWCAVAYASGQQNLLLTNGFLALVNIVGIWRWLGRVARHDDGARAAEQKSKHASEPTLIAVGALIGRRVVHESGTLIGKIVGVMAAQDTGQISFCMVGVGGVGGVGERLVALNWSALTIKDNDIGASLTAAEIAALPTVDAADWPVAAG